MRVNISIAMPSHNADRFGILTFVNFQENIEMTDRMAARQVLDEYEAAVLAKRQFIRRPGGSISVEYIYDATGRRMNNNMLNAFTATNVATDYNNYYGIIGGTSSNSIGYASLSSPTIYTNSDGTLTCG